MLLPHQWSILTIEDAKLLVDFIEKSTATKGLSRNYDKIGKMGILQVYNRLREFIDNHDHYECQVRYLDTSDFVRDHEK